MVTKAAIEAVTYCPNCFKDVTCVPVPICVNSSLNENAQRQRRNSGKTRRIEMTVWQCPNCRRTLKTRKDDEEWV